MISEYISAVPTIARFNDSAGFRVRKVGMDRNAHFTVADVAGSRDVSEYLARSIRQSRLIGRRNRIVTCARYALRLQPVHKIFPPRCLDQKRKQMPRRRRSGRGSQDFNLRMVDPGNISVGNLAAAANPTGEPFQVYPAKQTRMKLVQPAVVSNRLVPVFRGLAVIAQNSRA